MLDRISGKEYKDMIINAYAAIENIKSEINNLNVFPVPDGDTGTNMTLTMGAAVAELKKSAPSAIGKASEITANSLLRGARGNSGVILSLLFRGMAKYLKDKDYATSRDFAQALNFGVDAAYSAVMKPAEGTILTVSRITAQGATELSADQPDVITVMEYALSVGREALADTINQNPVLQMAGVIDAGGMGYLAILEGMIKSLKGEIIEPQAPQSSERPVHAAVFDTQDITFTYCTEFIVNRETGKNPHRLKSFLDRLGDSIVVIDDDELIKVHFHTNEPGVALTEALTYGALVSVKIENMRLQHTAAFNEEAASKSSDTPEIAQAPEKDFGIVVVSAGEGLSEVFKDLGADIAISGGQTMNPSTDDILTAISNIAAKTVFVFPNNNNIIMAAQQCIPLSDKNVIVIPTKSIPQGVSALLAYDKLASEDDNISSMTAAIQNVKTAQITNASRDCDFDGKMINAGEYLAIIDDSLLDSRPSLDCLIESAADAIATLEPEYITVFYGEDVSEEDAGKCLATLSEKLPDAEITLIYGGQPVYYYMISIE